MHARIFSDCFAHKTCRMSPKLKVEPVFRLSSERAHDLDGVPVSSLGGEFVIFRTADEPEFPPEIGDPGQLESKRHKTDSWDLVTIKLKG